MKFLMFLCVLFSFHSVAKDLLLKDYDYKIRDISQRNLSTPDLYKKMNRTLVRSKDSICSNRAHVWSWDFHLSDIDSPKIFLFFTPKTGHFDGVTWWYHVSPVVNEKGNLYVMDAGYPSKVRTPLLLNDWMKTFTGEKSVCKEIQHDDTDLVKLMNRGNTFPEETKHGKYNCYYKLVPPGYWTPSQVARNILGTDSRGRPSNFNRDDFDQDEVMDACIEASTTPLGWTWGSTLGKCRYFMSHGSLKI